MSVMHGPAFRMTAALRNRAYRWQPGVCTDWPPRVSRCLSTPAAQLQTISPPLDEVGPRRPVVCVLGHAANNRSVSMNASELMTETVQSCSASDSLQRAAQIMWDRDCGVVPVVDGDNCVVGMVTDRDIAMAAYTQGQPLWLIPVSWQWRSRCTAPARPTPWKPWKP